MGNGGEEDPKPEGRKRPGQRGLWQCLGAPGKGNHTPLFEGAPVMLPSDSKGLCPTSSPNGGHREELRDRQEEAAGPGRFRLPRRGPRAACGLQDKEEIQGNAPGSKPSCDYLWAGGPGARKCGLVSAQTLAVFSAETLQRLFAWDQARVTAAEEHALLLLILPLEVGSHGYCADVSSPCPGPR